MPSHCRHLESEHLSSNPSFLNLSLSLSCSCCVCASQKKILCICLFIRTILAFEFSFHINIFLDPALSVLNASSKFVYTTKLRGKFSYYLVLDKGTSSK